MKIFEEKDLRQLYRPPKDSHKGENGRVLVIGGSKLFHASIFWSAHVASKLVDLVHFSSPAFENIDIVRQRSKEKFWSGIVVDWDVVDDYIREDDSIVIGPGMPRDDGLIGDERPTGEIVNELLKLYPDKRWVVDGGALQEMDVNLISEHMLLTPHMGEFGRLFQMEASVENAQKMVNKYGCTILLKGVEDVVVSREGSVRIMGGNEGLTKGGTGDVLAGLAGAFYAKNEAVLSAAAASFILKNAADELYLGVGPYYGTDDLVKQIPDTLHSLLTRG